MIQLKLSLMILFKPIDVFYAVKRYRDKLNVYYSMFLFLMAFVSQYIFITIVHYPMTNMRPVDTNIILEFVKLDLPVLIWVVASYAITTIANGESKFFDIFNASALCMVPIIVFKPILGILSNFMSQDEAGLFNFIQTAITLWVLLLLFISLVKLNDYTLLRAIGISIVSIIAMLIICATGLLLYALTSQLLLFFSDLLREIRMAGLFS